MAILVDDLAQEMSDRKSHGIVFEDFDLPGLETVNGVVERDRDMGA